MLCYISIYNFHYVQENSLIGNHFCGTVD